MSWINDIRDLFARTELEKKLSEAQLQIEVADRIAEKTEDFRKNYEKVAQHDDAKAICDNLLKKIEVIK